MEAIDKDVEFMMRMNGAPKLETITITLPLGCTLASPIAELERAIYPQHAGLAALIGRTVDEESGERIYDKEHARAEALAEALETLCDAIDEFDGAIDELEGAPRSIIGDEFGKLLGACEAARCEL